MNAVELSPDTCMACEVLGYSSLAPFEYLGKKIEHLKDIPSVERWITFFLNVFNIGTLNASFNKSELEKADNKILNRDVTDICRKNWQQRYGSLMERISCHSKATYNFLINF